jgi:hypothetical protein
VLGKASEFVMMQRTIRAVCVCVWIQVVQGHAADAADEDAVGVSWMMSIDTLWGQCYGHPPLTVLDPSSLS